MKKLLAFVLAMIMLLSFVGCVDIEEIIVPEEPKEIPATITDNEGNTVEMTAKELKEIYDTNQPRFDKLYQGADITFVGTFKSVSTVRENGSSFVYDKVLFEEGWEVSLLAGDKEDFLIELMPGDKVKVESQVLDCFGPYVDIRGLYIGDGWTEKSLKQTKLSFAE